MNLRNNPMRWLILASAIAALAASSAQAGTGANNRPDSRQTAGDTSDVVSRYLRSHAIRPNDRAGLLGARTAGVVPDAFERYAGAHPYGAGLTTASVVTSDRFRWDDYGAGVGTGIVVALLLAGGLLATPTRRRQQTQPAVGR